MSNILLKHYKVMIELLIWHNCTFSDENKPWLVFIHGFGGTEKMWKHQVDDFKQTHNLLVLELPGHGNCSEGLSVYKSAGFDDVANAILQLLDEKNIKKADFICVSLGSLVMASIVAQRREIVNSVILCGAVFGMTFMTKFVYKFGLCFIHFLPFMLSVRFMSKILMPKSTHKMSRKFLISECRKLGRAEFIKWYELTGKSLNNLKNNLYLFDDIKNLVVMGKEDYVFLSAAKKAAQKYLVNLKIMENCGHVCSLQKWREFDSLVKDFFITDTINEKSSSTVS